MSRFDLLSPTLQDTISDTAIPVIVTPRLFQLHILVADELRGSKLPLTLLHLDGVPGAVERYILRELADLLVVTMDVLDRL